LGNYDDIEEGIIEGAHGHIEQSIKVAQAIHDIDARVTAVEPGLHAQNVTGAVTVAVEHEHTYELNATAAATVTLSGVPGCQAAVVWSGSAGTLEGTAMTAGATAVAVKLTAGWKIYVVGASTPGDTTAPIPGMLTPSAINSSGFSLTVTGASDDVALHALPFAFTTDNGVSWSAFQASNALAVTGKAAATAYQCHARVRDAAGNTADTAMVSVTTAAAGDSTPPTPGTIAESGITASGFTLTISGAADAGGLHATPYAFSTDNGATWSAYQASSVLAVTGKSASTSYQCRGRVRDAAGNTADTLMKTVTTGAASKTPDQVGSMFAWFDASDPAALTMAGSNVSAWADKSGNSRNASQATSGFQPTKTTINGKDAVQFNGAAVTRLRHSSTWTVDATVGYTMCIVARFDNAPGSSESPFSANPSGTFRTGAGGFGVSGGASVSGQTGAGVLFFTAMTVKNGGPSYTWVGSTKSAVSNNTTPNLSTAFQIGAYSDSSSPMTGAVCEVWLYPTIVSDADISALYSYAKTKWGTV